MTLPDTSEHPLASAARRLCAAFLLILVFAPAQAQAQTPIHFVAGPNLGTISSDEFDEAESKIGIFAAVGTSFMLSENVSLSPYVGYVQKGAEFNGEDASYDYIEIPVLLGTSFPVGETMAWSVFGGPQFGFQINCDEGGFDCTEFTNHKGTEFGAILGTGLSFPVSETGALAVSLGADLGLSDLFDELDYKTRTYFLSLQYSTTLGGD